MNDLKSRISLTAQELFLTEGVGGVSMRRIADRVGVSATAIYRHFRDKEAILEEIINAGLAILSNYLGPPLQAPDPFQRLKGLIEAYLRFAIEQPRYFDLAFMVPGHPTKLPEELERQAHATFRTAVEQVGLCMKAGIFRQGDPIQTAVYLWSTAHGLLMLYRMNRFGSDVAGFTRLYHVTIEQAIQGLLEKE